MGPSGHKSYLCCAPHSLSPGSGGASGQQPWRSQGRRTRAGRAARSVRNARASAGRLSHCRPARVLHRARRPVLGHDRHAEARDASADDDTDYRRLPAGSTRQGHRIPLLVQDTGSATSRRLASDASTARRHDGATGSAARRRAARRAIVRGAERPGTQATRPGPPPSLGTKSRSRLQRRHATDAEPCGSAARPRPTPW